MACDEGQAQVLREQLEGREGITEKKMFGGLCFLLNGNMVCGVHAGGAMFRVGKGAEAEARALPGVGPMTFTGRPMGGMVGASDDALADDAIRDRLTALAVSFAKSLPPK